MKHIQKKTGNAIRKERLFLKNKNKKQVSHALVSPKKEKLIKN